MAENLSSTVSLCCKEEEDTLEILERRWSDFPTDPLSVILQHLFLGDRHVFKAICKSWNSVFNAHCLPLPPPISSPYFDSPCFMYFSYKLDKWKFFHSLYNDSYCLDFPEYLSDAEICYSKNGWLLMSQGDDTYFFFNPSTNVKIELPLIDVPFRHVCFTSPPTPGGGCIIFGMVSDYPMCATVIRFGIIRFGEEEWTMYQYPNTYDFRSTNCSPVYCNGLFYCLNRSGNVGVFNPLGHWVQFNKHHGEKLNAKVIHQSYMAEVDGQIWGVFLTHDDRRVSVYKLDLDKFTWNPLQNLENKCLYVSPIVSFAENCDVKSLTNKIYFNKFHGQNGVVYSLAGRKYHSVGSGFANTETYWLNQVNHGAWFKPVPNKSNVNIVAESES